MFISKTIFPRLFFLVAQQLVVIPLTRFTRRMFLDKEDEDERIKRRCYSCDACFEHELLHHDLVLDHSGYGSFGVNEIRRLC